MAAPSLHSSPPSLEPSSARALQLPELLENIARRLSSKPNAISSAALVCKAWSPVFTAQLWRFLDVPPAHDDAFVAQLPRQGHHVRTLRLLGRYDHDMFFRACPNLVEVELTLSKTLDIAALYRMVKLAPHIERLHLNCCDGQALSWLTPLKDLDRLEKLEFINEPPANDGQQYDPLADQAQTLFWDAEGLPETEAHEGEQMWVYTDANGFVLAPMQGAAGSSDDEAEGTISPDHFGEFLIARASTLKHLSLEGLDVVGFKLFESSSAAAATARTDENTRPLPALAIETLNVSKTLVHNTATTIEPLLRQCPHLSDLDISGNFSRPWESFRWSILVDHCSRLTFLNLSSCTIDNDQLVRVVWASPGLCSLAASQSNVEGKVLNAIVDRWIGRDSQNRAVEPFRILDISWCSEVCQESVERILENIDTLISIKFSWCGNIGMSVFETEWGCPHLLHLEAQGLEQAWEVGEPRKVGKGSPEYTMFRRIATMKALQGLMIGSSDSVLTMENGFGQLMYRDERQGLNVLTCIMVLGSLESPLQVPEMEVIAAFPRLRFFLFGMDVVDAKMQQWLREKRPDVLQEEQRIYY